jgi:hypothetical protein
MDYGTKILEELIENIKKMSRSELRGAINKADLKYKNILKKRGESFKAPEIKPDSYQETMFPSSSATDFNYKLAA